MTTPTDRELAERLITVDRELELLRKIEALTLERAAAQREIDSFNAQHEFLMAAAEQRIADAQRERDEMRSGLSHLTNEMYGFMALLNEDAIRPVVGHTNLAVLKLRLAEAHALTKPTTGSGQ